MGRERNRRQTSKHLIPLILAPVLFLSVGTPGRAGNLAHRLDDLLNDKSKAGIEITAAAVDLDRLAPVYEYHANDALIPGSNAKIVLMAAALQLLGPEFTFETKILQSGDNLLIVGAGDPGMGDPKILEARGQSVTDVFERWADMLQARGINRIRGDIILDESIFDRQYVHPDWEPIDVVKWYGAPIGALNLNDNCIDITIFPTDRPGEPVRVTVVPPSDTVTIENLAKTGGGNALLHRIGSGFDFRVTGACDKEWPFPSQPVPDPGEFFGRSLVHVLTSRSIEVEGSVRRLFTADPRLNASATPIGSYHTPLPDVLERIGKNSQNMFAECLAKRLGYEWQRRQNTPHPVGSWDSWRAATWELLRNLKLRGMTSAGGDPWDGLILRDGSGLSRSNRASAMHLTRILVHMDTTPHAAMFRESLSAAGEDGSLARQGRLSELTGQLYAKTGTLGGVRALAGYLTTESNTRLAFAIIVNRPDRRNSGLTAITNDFCRMLANNGR